MLPTLFLSVLNQSITASLVIPVVLPVRLLLKKAPKIFSYALWIVVLFRLICPFSFESALGLLPINKTPIPQDIVYSTEPQIDTGLGIVDAVVNPILPIPSNTENSVNPLQIWVFVGSTIWAMGILAMMIYSIIQFVLLKRNLLGATPLRDTIYLADHISAPFVMGFIRPTIFLPSAMAEAEQVFIIAHEQHHIKRFDHIARIFAFMALTIHWFNPLAWISFVLSEKDMEMSCDEAVMKEMGAAIRTQYANSLLRFATGRRFISATPLAFGEGNTKERVKNVMTYKKPMLWVSMIAFIAVMCVCVGFISNPVPNETVGVSIENLWKNRTEYVGNNTAVGNILFGLSFPDTMQYKSFALKTQTPPYEIIVYFEERNAALKAVDHGDGQTETAFSLDSVQLEQNARIMFSLIGNVGKITFSVNRKEGEALTNQYIRNNYEELFTKTVLYEEFQTVLSEILDNSKTNRLAAFEAIEIGTKKDNIHAQFGAPNAALSGMHGDIYIAEGKQIVIYYGLEGEDGYPVTEVKMSDYIPKKLTHEQAVALALTTTQNRYLEGECFAEGHHILGYDDSDNAKTKIYALAMVGWYGFENNHFVKVSGSGSIPVVITVASDNTVDIEYPQDGSYYKPSIEKMFPKQYHDRIFDLGDTEREYLKQQEETAAKEYLSKIGRDVKIGAYADFSYVSLPDVGVSVEVSNALEDFYKQHSHYPTFIGTRERLENGLRIVYEMSYDKNQDEIRFTKYKYDTKETIEQFVVNAKTSETVKVLSTPDFSA